MKTDPDFTQVQLKANASGSWMNVCRFRTAHYESVRAACLMLARAAESRLKFKLLDAAGGELEHIDGKFPIEWREARK